MINFTHLAYQTITDYPGYMASSSSADELGSLFTILFYGIYCGVVLVVYYVTLGISLMKLGSSLGYKHSWFAWVPILNIIMRLNLAGFSGWYIFMGLLLLIPVLGWLGFIGFYIYIWMIISKRCGKPDFLALLLLVPLGNIILPLYLAYSSGSPSQDNINLIIDEKGK